MSILNNKASVYKSAKNTRRDKILNSSYNNLQFFYKNLYRLIPKSERNLEFVY